MHPIYFIIAITIYSCSPSVYVPAKSSKAFVDPRDGERYGYVEIDDREWMTENIRYNVEGSKLNPDNPSPLYGRLYNWKQAQKACPEGWRLSTNGDWMSLESIFIKDVDLLLKKRATRGTNVKILKSKQYWQNTGTDSLKMNILPAGNFNQRGFSNLNTVAGFWTLDAHLAGGKLAENFAYYRIIEDKEQGIYYDLQDKTIYYSCRCVRSLKNNPFKER